LVIGGVAFAAGALIGSMFSLTTQEESVLTGAGRQAIDAARENKDELLMRTTRMAEAATVPPPNPRPLPWDEGSNQA
jgi:hypothetical protein